MSIEAGKIKGSLEYAKLDGGTIELFGWAMDVEPADTVERVLVFEDGQYVYSNATGMPRRVGELKAALLPYKAKAAWPTIGVIIDIASQALIRHSHGSWAGDSFPGSADPAGLGC